ncbi:hypothetical protein EUX98_g9429 [Antrodiella citrinella]|uniref:Uncharacterized protein n=1 Tax=Antrodiella citrinella TaxID=2447956 RepID=A0A4S4LTU9_9APHY|nr:hypothetical protein EUX98_g9429 [Antrodiella citrinella]
MVGTCPSNIDKHPGHVVLQQTTTRAPRRTSAQVKADKKALDTEKADAKERQRLLAARIAELEAKLAKAEANTHQVVVPETCTSKSEKVGTHLTIPDRDVLLDEDEPDTVITSSSLPAAAAARTSGWSKKLTRSDIEALHHTQAEPVAATPSKRKASGKASKASNKKVKPEFPLGVAANWEAKVKTSARWGCSANTLPIQQLSASTTLSHKLDLFILGSAVVAKIKATGAFDHFHNGDTTPEDEPSSHEVVYGGYISDSDDDEAERSVPQVEATSWSTNVTTVGIVVNAPQPAQEATGPNVDDVQAAPQPLTAFQPPPPPPPGQHFYLHHLPLPPTKLFLFTKKFVATLIRLVGKLSDPWGSMQLVDWSALYKMV